MTGTHTFAILDLSPEAYAEIARKLREAGYGHSFTEDHDGRELIDMHGLAVRSEGPAIDLRGLARRSGPATGQRDGSG